MPDLEIGYLKLNIENAAGHEHRVRPIALRAVALLAERLDGPGAMGAHITSGRYLEALRAAPLDLNLNRMSNEQAAEGIAGAWVKALTSKPKE